MEWSTRYGVEKTNVRQINESKRFGFGGKEEEEEEKGKLTAGQCSVLRKLRSACGVEHQVRVVDRLAKPREQVEDVGLRYSEKQQTILDSRAGREYFRDANKNRVRQPTKTESPGQYRRREDQYLCIEIQPSNG